MTLKVIRNRPMMLKVIRNRPKIDPSILSPFFLGTLVM